MNILGGGNPWFLKAARNWHKLHHHKQNWDIGHGLTTRFWDMIFGTYPDGNVRGTVTWKLYEKYPWSKYLSVPLPLLDFLLIHPLLEKEEVIYIYICRERDKCIISLFIEY